MTEEMKLQKYTSKCLQHDQAFHNWLLWTNKFEPVKLWRQEDGPINTVGWPEHIHKDKDNNLINKNGELYNVVHQYDRHKDLSLHFTQKYG